MDLAISGLNIMDKEDMIDKLNAMADVIEEWPFKAKMKAIPTASIPVIKVVSPFLSWRAKDIDVAKLRAEGGYEYDSEVECELLQLDITFDDSAQSAG